MTAFLHAHGGGFVSEVLLESLIETLRVSVLLFLTYLLMEFIEHKAPAGAEKMMRRAGRLAPALGGALGAVPQCGFSAAAAGLYSGRVISLGALLAVFLSTSDEMLPVLLAGSIDIGKILLIIVYKAAVGILVGFGTDLVLRLLGKGDTGAHIEEMCEEGGCHCERGIFRSALHHTLGVSAFVLAATLGVSTLVFFIGEDSLASLLPRIPLFSHLVAALIGLIPSCAFLYSLSLIFSESFVANSLR